MKQTVLGESPYIFQKKLRKKIALCIAAGALTIGLNILFTALRTEQSHILMLLLNIGTDILCGVYLLYAISVHIAPQYRLYRLALRPKSTVNATVQSISAHRIRYMDLDCYEITADDHRFFLPADTIPLKEHDCYTFFLVSNTIVEVEQ